MGTHFNRRRFLVSAGAAASAVLTTSLFDLKTVSAASYTRRNLGGMAASDPVLVSYQKAIKAMKALDTSSPLSPLSWKYQAAIHGTTDPSALAAWNTCEHGTNYFWSWHRMYLYWFERIIRKMSDDSSWALPYWDYSSASQRHLPVSFQDPASELYLANRGPHWNDGSASYASYRVDPSSGNMQTDYFLAQSELESNPHDNVHVDMGGLMGNPKTAAADPVFYVHHSNIDRLWNLWLAQGMGRTDPLTNTSEDTDWRNKTYLFFDENGKAIHMNTCDILRAAEQLNYTYESEPPQVKEYCLVLRHPQVPHLIKEPLIRWPGPPVELGEKEVSIEIRIKEVRQRLASFADTKADLLLLELNDVEAEKSPGVIWDVYLGLPAGTEPNPVGPFFVGTVALFSAGIRNHSHGEFKPAHFSLNAKRAIIASLRSNAEQLRLLFVPGGPLIDGKPSRVKVLSPVRIGTIQLSLGKTEMSGREKN